MSKTVAAVVIVLVLVGAGWWRVATTDSARPKTSYSQFLGQVRTGQVSSAVIMAGDSGASETSFRLKNGNAGKTILPGDYRDALSTMQDNLVDIQIQKSSEWGKLFNLLPFLLLLAFWLFLMRRFQGPEWSLVGRKGK
jgi:ATP-dependent Zn protease